MISRALPHREAKPGCSVADDKAACSLAAGVWLAAPRSSARARASSEPTRVMGGVFSKKDVRVLIAGLDAAGKTTILYKLKKGQKNAETPVSTIPTLNFNVENCRYKNTQFAIWDVGGQDSLRPLWRHYYTGTQGLIYVVDSNDRDRLRKAAEELHKMVLDNEMRFAVLLIFANKTDLPHSLSVEEITQELRLEEIKDRKWKVQPACAITGEGLWVGLQWLGKNVKSI